jgi:hypothetical protein
MMTAVERKLLSEETGGAEPLVCVRSRTRIDAGRWWRKTPVWLCIARNELILLAVARRRYLERVAIADCQASHYCHATGELVIETPAALRFNRLALSPRQALEILQVLNTRHQADSRNLITQTNT